MPRPARATIGSGRSRAPPRRSTTPHRAPLARGSRATLRQGPARRTQRSQPCLSSHPGTTRPGQL